MLGPWANSFSLRERGRGANQNECLVYKYRIYFVNSDVFIRAIGDGEVERRKIVTHRFVKV